MHTQAHTHTHTHTIMAYFQWGLLVIVFSLCKKFRECHPNLYIMQEAELKQAAMKNTNSLDL